jgi:hypothetical protein
LSYKIQNNMIMINCIILMSMFPEPGAIESKTIPASNKSILNEYCQKNKLDMPVYHTTSSNDTNRLYWNCKLKFLDTELETDISSTSKINAEQQVAGLALEYLKTNSNTSPKLTEEYSGAIYLIDLENKPAFGINLNTNNIYIGFHNSIHHSIPKYADWHECKSSCLENELSLSQTNKLIYLIEGGVSDLVDHLMTMFVYPLVMYLKTNPSIQTVCIVSGDHAGFCTKACLEKALGWSNLKGITIKNLGSF